MVGVGQLVSIVSPIQTGLLLHSGCQPSDLFYLMAIPLLAGSAGAAEIGLSQRLLPSNTQEYAAQTERTDPCQGEKAL